MKKEWTKPKLVVLFRARADESVLGFCKVTDVEEGPGTNFKSCDNYDLPAGGCAPEVCEAWMTS